MPGRESSTAPTRRWAAARPTAPDRRSTMPSRPRASISSRRVNRNSDASVSMSPMMSGLSPLRATDSREKGWCGTIAPSTTGPKSISPVATFL